MAYAGRPGTTRTERIHFTCPCGTVVSAEVHVAVDIAADPELGARLMADDPARRLNVVRCPKGEVLPVDLPIVYHDPNNEIFALVMPESMRHRELAERSRLYAELAEDTRVPVPAYVRDAPVVFGAAGLRDLVEGRAEVDLAEARLAERDAELERMRIELERVQNELDSERRSIAAQRAELERLTEDLDRRSTEIEARGRAAAERDRPRRARADSTDDPGAGMQTDPFHLVEQEETTDNEAMEIEPEPIGDDEVLVADQVVDEELAPRPVSADGATRVGGAADVAIERWIVSRERTLAVVDDRGAVRFAASAGHDELDGLLGPKLELRLQLHRLPSYPLIDLAIGSPASIRGKRGASAPLCIALDLADGDHRAVLDTLADDFSFSLELYDAEYLPVKKRTVAANLSDNVRYVLAVAEDYLDGLEPGERSFDKAVVAFDNPAFDRFGRSHPEAKELREDKLTRLESASGVRRALAMVRHFTRPAREEYLVLVRGYPLAVWRQRRRAVLERALELGLWVGPELARVAVSEGLARSKKDLVQRLRQRFTRLAADGDHDLDEDAVADNAAALDAEADALGVSAPRAGDAARVARATPIASGAAPIASGTIPGARVATGDRPNLTARSHEELVAMLDDKRLRLHAAIELARRGDGRAVRPVFAAMRKMTRAEAVAALSAATGFGAAATPALIAGLRSHKGFLRQGCALTLGIIKDEEGVEALADLLTAEPTEIWKEVARAVGEVGTGAIMPIAARIARGDEGGRDDVRERVAWALAHIVAKSADGRGAVETLAGGRDAVVGAVARHALELAELARSDDLQVRGPSTPKDQTVKRAFSRRFFQALEGSGDTVQHVEGHVGADTSGPAMLLDEADLLEASELEEGAEELDESDLIPT